MTKAVRLGIFYFSASVLLCGCSDSYKNYLEQKDSLKQAIGLYTYRNYSEAVPVFKQLADKGNPLAQRWYAVALQTGNGVEKSEEEAYKLFNKSFVGIKKFAEKGDSVAQYNLGLSYLEENVLMGAGQPDAEQANKWLRAAAEQGNVDAQYMLGLFYLTGKQAAFHQDLVEARKWLVKASAQGNSGAESLLKLTGIKGLRNDALKGLEDANQ